MENSKIFAWENKDNIGILSIDNPPQNYLTEPDFLDLSKLKEWTADETLKGIILTGKGRHFSAGADFANLKRLSRDPGLLYSKMTRGKEILDYLDDLELPTIAAIRGACFGGGLEIALACHIRVSSQNALYAFPEINLNLLPGLGGTVRLTERLPYSTALQILLAGGIVSAEQALEIGLADHLVPARQVYNFSLSLMKKMVDARPVEVIRSVVRALNNSRRMSAREAMEEETRMFCELAAKILDDE
jgi:enoyl-CoA hydratase/carnithine racemase